MIVPAQEEGLRGMYHRPVPLTPDGYVEVGAPEQLAALYAALGAAQGAFTEIHRSHTVTVKMREGGSYNFSYAPLEDLLAATRPALAANKLVVLTPIVRNGTDGAADILVVIAHGDGGRIMSRFSFVPRGEMKDVGGQVTYLRRYGYSAMLNLAADDDADDEPQQAVPAPRTAAASPASPPIQRAPASPVERDSSLWQAYMGVRDEARTTLPDEVLAGLPILMEPGTKVEVEAAGKQIRAALLAATAAKPAREEVVV